MKKRHGLILKLLCASAAACLIPGYFLLSGQSSGTANAADVSANQTVSGDCDGNGICNLADAEYLQGYLLTDCQTVSESADLDGNQIINAADLTILKRMLMQPESREKVTLMVYFSGANLESDYAEVSGDIQEMMSAEYTDSLQIVAMTGGAKKWHTHLADSDANYRITLNKDGIQSEKMDGEPKDMADYHTLQSFITETAAEYPADRYALVIWGHGAGPLYGLCYDEITEKTMYLPDLHDALAGADVHFDWIGFDCCIMGNLETALAVYEYADYMVACPSVMSSLGWAYEPFITKWSKDPECPSEEIGAYIADTSIDANLGTENSAAMACYDLQYIEELTHAVHVYINDLYAAFLKAGIEDIYEARTMMLDSEAIGFSTYDTVDIVSLVTLLPAASHSEDIINLVSHTVTHRALLKAGDLCGIMMWFPEKYPPDGFTLMPSVYQDLGISEEYISQMSEMSFAMYRFLEEKSAET
ncbi:MAG: hypothetical protein IKI58_04025 [Oscillospiraceae bacterium]|nr:hypothetical protein [Oscillospiraceae bacterium]